MALLTVFIGLIFTMRNITFYFREFTSELPLCQLIELTGAILFCVKRVVESHPLTSVAFGLEKLKAKEVQTGAR